MKSPKNAGYALLVAAALLWVNSTDTKAGTITNDTRAKIEQIVSSDIVDNVQQRTWIKLPAWYDEKIRDFIANNDILKNNNDLLKFIEDFIVEQMNKKPWWVNPENRCLYVYNLCFEYLSDKDLYSWEDGNEERTMQFIKVAPVLTLALDEFIHKVDQFIVTWIYIKLNYLVDIYNSFKERPQTIRQSDIEEARQLLVKQVIPLCNMYDIDYKKKLSVAAEFYGIIDTHANKTDKKPWFITESSDRVYKELWTRSRTNAITKNNRKQLWRPGKSVRRYYWRW